jgi:hypothetical protein
LAFASGFLDATKIKFNQNVQSSGKNNNQVTFVNLKKLSLDFNKIPLKKVRKISLHQGRLYILEKQRGEIFVLDIEGHYLYSIGGPGQGAVDLEYPFDFFFSKNFIYVLNPISRRIEIFDLNGKSVSRIHLRYPRSFFSLQSLLVTDNYFIIGSDFNELVSLFDKDGIYKKAILKSKPPLEVPATGLIGYPAQLAIVDDSILHFNRLTGEFIKLKQKGGLEKIFRSHSRNIKLEQKIRNESAAQSAKNGNPKTYSALFSNCCVDNRDLIYLIPLVNKKTADQKMLVYNSVGRLVYQTWPRRLRKALIQDVCCDGDIFVFLSSDFDLFRCERKIIE